MLGTVAAATVAIARNPGAFDARRMAALTAVIFIGLQLSANYWSVLYVAWIAPLLVSLAAGRARLAAGARAGVPPSFAAPARHRCRPADRSSRHGPAPTARARARRPAGRPAPPRGGTRAPHSSETARGARCRAPIARSRSSPRVGLLWPTRWPGPESWPPRSPAWRSSPCSAAVLWLVHAMIAARGRGGAAPRGPLAARRRAARPGGVGRDLSAQPRLRHRRGRLHAGRGHACSSTGTTLRRPPGRLAGHVRPQQPLCDLHDVGRRRVDTFGYPALPLLVAAPFVWLTGGGQAVPIADVVVLDGRDRRCLLRPAPRAASAGRDRGQSAFPP